MADQTIRNCFWKSGISLEAQEGSMDDHDDPFKWMVDDGEDGSAVDELGFDLNQLPEARPDLAPEKLDADGLWKKMFLKENVSERNNLYIFLFLSLCNTLHPEETSSVCFFQNLAEIISTPIIWKLM